MGPSSSLLLLALLFLVTTPIYSTRDDLLAATEEMQHANYFTFVLLINMSPPGKIPANVTFLMPTDRMLSKTAIPENAVSEFLLRHSIPSALPFDHLLHFPSNSVIPSSSSDYTIRVLNNGSRSFFLNNVRLIRPNLCLNGSSVRCHGIDGILPDTTPRTCPCSPGSPPPPVPAQALVPASAPVEAPPSPSPPPPEPYLVMPPEFPAPPPPGNWTEAVAPEPGVSGTRSSRSGVGMGYLDSLVVMLVLFVYAW